MQAAVLVALGVSPGLRALRIENVTWVTGPPDGFTKYLKFVFGDFGPWMTAIAQVVLLCGLWMVERDKVVPVESEDNEVDEHTPLLREV